MGLFDDSNVRLNVLKQRAYNYRWAEVDDGVIPLTAADPDFPVAEPVRQAMIDYINGGYFSYTPKLGLPEFKQAISDGLKARKGEIIDPELILPIDSAARGMYVIARTVLAPGDEMIVFDPVDYLFRESCLAAGGKVALFPAKLKDGWIDLSDLESYITPKTRMIGLCNPHNPIGIAWPASVLRQVASLARKHGVIVFDDEIHSDLMLYGHKHAAFAAVSDDAAAVALTLGAPTKTFNIAGLESSWCVVKNPDLRKPFYNWLGTNELNSPTMVATLATEAAYTCGEPWLEQCLHYIEANVDYVAAYCRQHLDGIVAVKPQASYLVWLDCTALGLSHEQLVSLFVDKAHLALNDGAMFGRGGEGHMRLNCATPRSNLVEAMRRLTDAI